MCLCHPTVWWLHQPCHTLLADLLRSWYSSPVTSSVVAGLWSSMHRYPRAPTPAGTPALPTTLRGKARGHLHRLVWWWSWPTMCSLWLWKSEGTLHNFDQRSSTAPFVLETPRTSFETLKATARLGLCAPALPCNPNLPADNEMLRCCSARTSFSFHPATGTKAFEITL